MKDYQWSSFKEYISAKNASFVTTNLVLSFFKSVENYNKFTLDHADYQRTLGEIKHLTFE